MPTKKLRANEIGLPRFELGAENDGGIFELSSHRRAREALEFALAIEDRGFNVFVLGADRSGRMTATLDFLNAHINGRAVPDDWIFLINFRRPHRPRPYRVPAGSGRAFRDRMTALIPQLREALRATFGSEEHQAKLRAESEEIRSVIGGDIEALRAEARTHGLGLAQTPQGLSVVAIDADGQPQSPDTIPAERRAALDESAGLIGEKLRRLTRQATRMQTELEVRLGDRARQAANDAIGGLVDELAAEYADHRGIARWLVDMRADILDNLRLFQEAKDGIKDAGVQPPERRYAVNLLVDHGDETQPQVVVEANPTYENLFGRIEYRQTGGVLDTDFTMIRAGALHRANGGLLVLRAEALAANRAAWDFLKGALRDGEIRVEELYRTGAMPLAGAPRPKPIPLEVKVVIVGAPQWYYTFFTADPEFQSYFKVKADIDAEMDATAENLACYAGLIQRMARASGAAGCEPDAARRLLGVSARWAASREKLSAQFERLADVLGEAVAINGGDGKPVTEESVAAALANRRRRNARVEDRVQEAISRGTVMIDTAGAVVGQINALTVRQLGDHAFGAPSRITARASVGRRGIINIERDAALGGPIQQKGAMVLQGFLAGHFARHLPLSFNCSITFEQSYGGVEGDSASLAELLAVLSDLADLPLRQSLAITGSVNQRGQAQAIGGVQHKVEGFFRTCREAGGPNADQGLVIPAANVIDLVLRDDVVEAVEAGKFHIWSVDTVEEALELFTGREAGTPDAEGAYHPDSVYGRVMAQVAEFDRILAEREGMG